MKVGGSAVVIGKNIPGGYVSMVRNGGETATDDIQGRVDELGRVEMMQGKKGGEISKSDGRAF